MHKKKDNSVTTMGVVQLAERGVKMKSNTLKVISENGSHFERDTNFKVTPQKSMK